MSEGSRVAIARGSWLERYFYFGMAVLIAVVIVYGFSQTIGRNLFHPVVPRPWILKVHAVVFFGWVAFYIFQSGLVRVRKVAWHRLAGWFGVGLGIVIPVLGVTTAIAMTRFKLHVLHQDGALADLIIPLFDMLCFTPIFVLAVYWRKKPELHRRLMLVASCVLTAAAWGRFPATLLRPEFFYAGVDSLILLGVVRDWIVNRRVHAVYLYVLPVFMVGQSLVTYSAFHELEWWRRVASAIVN